MEKIEITLEEYKYLVTVGAKAGIITKGILDSASLSSYGGCESLMFDHSAVDLILRSAASVEYDDRMSELKGASNE